MAQVTDYRNDIRPNWCPGCGHYGVQAAITDAVTQLDIAPERLAVISGIGWGSPVGGGGFLFALAFFSRYRLPQPYRRLFLRIWCTYDSRSCVTLCSRGKIS